MANRFGLSDRLIETVRNVCNEKVATKEELKGDQHKLDVAEPKGKLTSADFKKLQTGKEQVNVNPDLPESSHVSIGSKDRITRQNPWVTIHKNISGYEKDKPALIGSMGLNVAADIHGFKVDPETIHKAGVGKRIPVKNRDGKEMFVALSQNHAKEIRKGVSALGQPLGTTNEETELDENKILFHPGEKATVHKIDNYGLQGRDLHPPESGVEGHHVRITSYGNKNYGIEGGKRTWPGANPRFQVVKGKMATGPHKGKEFEFAHYELKKPVNEEPEQVEEREMTSAEMKKREEIVKSMKKNFAGFKERYGKRGKDVMYATATKQAMKEED